MASAPLRLLRLPLLLVAVALLGSTLGACGGRGEREVEIRRPRLLQTPSGRRIFAGTLVNHGSSTISIAEIEVALYNNKGSRIETMRIQVEDIPPQDSTKFRQTIDSDRPIQQAQVQGILIP